MKLERVQPKNFRSIKNLAFTFPKSGFLVLVGANNAGKSNIIRAIDAMCGDQWFGSSKVDAHDHYLRDTENQIQISLATHDLKDRGHGMLCFDHQTVNERTYLAVTDSLKLTYGVSRSVVKCRLVGLGLLTVRED